ncbi:MAG TPA: hypothetical protein VMT94_05025 [Burkholderiales bacterium]|nr:hypothetical protein [Burkholderiales bacterium]
MSLEDTLYPLLKSYARAPDWVKASIGRTYALLPERVRLGSAVQHFRDELAVVDAGTIAGISKKKLSDTLTWAIETVPAYRGYRRLLTDVCSPHELLLQLPTLAKDQIKQDLADFTSEKMPATERLEMFTGGSTANPMRFYLRRNVSRSREYAFMEAFRARCGISAKDTVLALRGRTVPTASEPGGRLWLYEPIRRQIIFSSDHLEERYMPQYVDALSRLRPTAIEAFPSALYPLARWLEANPLPDFVFGLKGVLLYSENVYDYQSRLFRKVFKCPVLKHYGHSERVLMATSMVDDERYFFWPQYGHFELLDVSGAPVTRPGEIGEIVGTSFDNRAMPFIRYRTGDFAVLGDKSHPRFPGYPVCERIEGRLQEFLVCRDHRLISITTMGAAHFEELSEVREIQYEQTQPGLVTLKVVARELGDGLVSRIKGAVHEKTQGGCEVRVVKAESIPRTERGKHRMLIQHLDLRPYFGAGGTA